MLLLKSQGIYAGDTVKDFLEVFPTISFEQVRHLPLSSKLNS